METRRRRTVLPAAPGEPTSRTPLPPALTQVTKEVPPTRSASSDEVTSRGSRSGTARGLHAAAVDAGTRRARGADRPGCGYDIGVQGPGQRAAGSRDQGEGDGAGSGDLGKGDAEPGSGHWRWEPG